ncbi:unnamed protein product [Schistosoma rodhaini]|nr:unnamed protein product [Schistosoma rodhaini]
MVSKTIEIDNSATLYNCNPNINDYRNTGVGFVVSNHSMVTATDFKEIDGRIATIKIRSLATSQTINLIGCYAPTESSSEDISKDKFYLKLKNTIKQLKSNKLPILVLGDFNCRLGQDLHTYYPNIVGKANNLEPETSANGIRLINLCETLSLRVMNTFITKPAHKTHTWVHPKTQTGHIIDLVLTENNSRIMVSDIHNSRSMEANTDHYMVTTILKLKYLNYNKIPNTNSKRKQRQRKAIHALNPEYPNILNNLLQNNHNLNQIEKAMIQAAHKAAIPYKSATKRWQHNIGNLLKEEIKHRKQLRLNWLNNPTTTNKNLYMQASKIVKNKVKLAKDQYIKDRISEMNSYFKKHDLHLAYKMLDDILATIRNHSYKAKRTNQVKDSDLQYHYQNLFNAKLNLNNTQVPLKTTQDPELTLDEIKIGLKNMKNQTTPGSNGITTEMIKQGGYKLIDMLLNIMNKIWKNPCTMPDHWLDAEVISIYKNKGLRSDPNNYRSIFLLDTIGKLFAGIVCNRLVQQTDNYLPITQFGFRKNLSTIHAITTLRHLIQTSIDTNCTIVLTFVDLTKAFDTIPKQLIIDTLAKICPSNNINSCIIKLLDNPKGHLRNTELNFTMHRGVRQGSKEGPAIFNLVFQNILEHTIDKTLKGVTLRDQHNKTWTIKHLEYADDLCLITNTTEEATKALNHLQQYLTSIGMEISISKTKYMIINKKGNSANVKIGNKDIEEVESFHYLGSTINNKGTPDSAITYNIEKAKNAIIKIKPILKSKELSLDTKMKLVDSSIIPILTYGLESIVLRKQDWSRLEAVLNTVRRIILGINDRKQLTVEQLRHKINLPNLANKIMQNRLNLWYVAHKRPNNLMVRSLNSNFENQCNNRKAHTRNWLRQLLQDIKEMGERLPSNWINQPNKVKINTHQEYFPKIIGKRQMKHVCQNANCNRMFATIKEMNRHLRNDHQNKTNSESLYSCPLSDCNKTYKTLGWLIRHMQSCHPQCNLAKAEPKNKVNKIDSKNDQNKCPYPGCNKTLPTKKGIINHCYVVHRWSAITGQEVKPKTKNNAKTTIAPR